MLDLTERDTHAEAVALHRDLLKLRSTDAVFGQQRAGAVDGAVPGDAAFVLRYLGDAGDDRVMLVNVGPQLELKVLPEPLLAPPRERDWAIIWSSEDARYGGDGTPAPEFVASWSVPAQCALVFAAQPEQ